VTLIAIRYIGFRGGGSVVESTAGLCGDLQGIAGRSLLEIDGLELPMLAGHIANDAAE
jgi:hypothetical protein